LCRWSTAAGSRPPAEHYEFQSTLSHRIQQLEANLGVRLLNRTSRRFGMTDAGEEFYRHAVLMLREAELAETAIRVPPVSSHVRIAAKFRRPDEPFVDLPG